jgi:ribonuclease T
LCWAPKSLPVFYLSLDIEASGPFPGLFSLVSIGALPVRRHNPKPRRSAPRSETRWIVDQEQTFYVELQPLQGAGELAAATEVHGLTPDYLATHGVEPRRALKQFQLYLAHQKTQFGKFMPASWPASFDAPFVGHYFQQFLGENPLGYNALDIASLAQGYFGCPRAELRSRMAHAGLARVSPPYPHNALTDAIAQAELLANLLNLTELPESE